MKSLIHVSTLALLTGTASGSAAPGGRWDAVPQPDLEERLQAAQPLPVEDVCVPVKSVRVGETMLVPNPDGKTYDILQWYFKGYGGPTSVYLVDLATGAVKRDGIPLGRQIHICGRVLGPDGKLYLATPDWKKGMELYVYDPAENTLTCRGVIAPGLAGETRPMVIGTDGKVYGSGSYADSRKAGAYQLDTATGEVTDYGPIGPSHAPAGCWGYYLAADDEYVYVASGKVPWYLVALNRRTREEKVLLETERVRGMISVHQLPDGCTARASHLAGGPAETTEYWLYQGRAIRKVGGNPPWPRRAATAGRRGPPKPEIYAEALDPDSNGKAALWYRLPEAKAAAPANPPPGTPAETLGWKRIPLDVDVFPMLIRRLTEMPDGRLLGTADSYLGSFLFDPSTGKYKHPGKIALSHYSTAFAGGKAYLSGYPSSALYVYDPSRLWSVGHGVPGSPAPPETDAASNPRRLTYLNQWTRTHKMYAAAVGADGRVYFGGECIRDANGGGLGWWDPATGTAGGFWEALTAYQIHFLTAADGGRLLVASTIAVRDDTRGNWTPPQAKLFIYDVAAGRFVREVEPVPGAKSTGAIVEVRPGLILGATTMPGGDNPGVLYGVDARTGEVLFRKPVPGELRFGVGTNTSGQNEFRLGPDGCVWLFVGNVLARIRPDDFGVEVLGKVTPPGRIAFAGRDLYLGGTTSLRRIRLAVPGN